MFKDAKISKSSSPIVSSISAEVNESRTRFPETDETRDLSTKELKRLVLLEELDLIRIKKRKLLNNNLK